MEFYKLSIFPEPKYMTNEQKINNSIAINILISIYAISVLISISSSGM